MPAFHFLHRIIAPALLCFACASHAAVVVENLDQPVRNPAHVQGGFWSAQSFITAAGQAALLERVTLRLGVRVQTPDIQAELRADEAGVPGALLTTFSLSEVSAGATENELLLPDAGVALAPASTYWLVMGVSGSGGFDWSYAAGNAASGNGAFAEYAYSLTQGATWIGFGLEDPYMARIEVAGAVPEPEVAWLLAAGLGAVWWVQRRRKSSPINAHVAIYPDRSPAALRLAE